MGSEGVRKTKKPTAGMISEIPGLCGFQGVSGAECTLQSVTPEDRRADPSHSCTSQCLGAPQVLGTPRHFQVSGLGAGWCSERGHV